MSFKLQKEDFNLSSFLKDQSSFEFEKYDKKLYGIDKEFILDLFMPKDSNFQNKVMELTVEENKFIYYPFVYPESVP